jgi:DNA-binding response OmpR family regulator
MGLRVLIVEDQADVAANIWDFLERRGHVVDHAADGENGLARALAGDADVVVLDLGLPRLDGLDLCRRLREAGRGVPVLMLTARDTLDDKLRGFAEGADDYMVKPFALRELEARIQALHRRSRPLARGSVAVGELAYDPASMLATRAGTTIALTRAQACLLEALLRAHPAVVSHPALMRAVWGDGEADIASLHSHIYELRALVDRPFAFPMIQTMHGLGYRLVAPP